MIKLKNISKKFRAFTLEEINLEINEGEYFVMLGRSGSGKSLILELISGIQKPSSGEVFIDGRDITGLPIHKRKIGLLFQSHALFPHMTVRENIRFALPRSQKNIDSENYTILFNALNITHLLDRYPMSLSLGESHRAALARTLVINPHCLLLDEPLSSLDAHTKYEIRSLLRRINKGLLYFGKENRNRPMTVIHVTHDYEEALALASTVAVIESGRIIQMGEPRSIFKHPETPFVASFVGIKNFYRGIPVRLEGSDEGAVFKITGAADKYFFISGSNVEFDEECSIIIRSEDVILSRGRFESSARNVFEGTIVDMENCINGAEVTVDIGGMEITALITYASLRNMKLLQGERVFASFKASSAHYS